MVKPSVKAAAASRPRAMSLHIGLNLVDPKHYGGWSGPLAACELDARDMAAIAKSQGMAASQLLTKAGTRKAVLAGIRAAAAKLGKGDLFFLSFSGHGGQVADVSGDEPDKQDETWCLYDGQLIDDELYFELGKFGAGVRILVLSDSCHSGTVTRARPVPPPAGMRSKLMPLEVGLRVYAEHQAFYDRLQTGIAQAAGKAALTDPDAVLAALALQGPRIGAIAKKFRAAAILISGCQDNQVALDGDHNGAFTARLREVWNNGRFAGSYAQFHARIVAGMPASQTPNLFLLGSAAAFVAQAPFSV
jgi:metacaspase-1